VPDAHALVTGPITGRIPHGDGFIDVTPDVLHFDSQEEAVAAAESIGVEHAVRGTHPLQAECAALGPLAEQLDKLKLPKGAAEQVNAIFEALTGQSLDAVKKAVDEHRTAHRQLNKKAGL
jgi:hypothetical protein